MNATVESHGKPRFAFLDYGRVLACVMVVLYHASGTASLPKYFGDHPLGEFFALGFVRMPFFFAMSGFLLAWFYLKPGSTMKPVTFLAKRVSRLFPLYWMVLCLVAAVEIFVLRHADVVPGGWDWWATFLLLPQDAGVVGGTGAPVLYPAWVLQYELIGYLLITLALTSRWLRFAYLCTFPVFFLLWADSEVFALRFLASDWLLVFWFGAVAAWAARAWTHARLQWVMRAALVCLGTAAVMQWLLPTMTGEWKTFVNFHLFYGAGFALLMAGLVNASRNNRTPMRTSAWSDSVTTFAVWTYAIFLLHAPVITFVCKVLIALGFRGENGWILAVSASLVISVAAGAVVQRVIEAPVDRLIVRGWRGLRARMRSQLTV